MGTPYSGSAARRNEVPNGEVGIAGAAELIVWAVVMLGT